MLFTMYIVIEVFRGWSFGGLVDLRLLPIKGSGGSRVASGVRQGH